MSGFRAVPAVVRPVGLIMVAVLACGAANLAQARGGFFDFFDQGSGGDTRPLPQPEYDRPDAPPLTVRAHPHRHKLRTGAAGGSQRYDPAALRGITIYTDRTLVRGDVVMTADGIRVFNGSSSWPHTADDFTAVASTGRVSPSLRKELTAINAASSPGWQR